MFVFRIGDDDDEDDDEEDEEEKDGTITGDGVIDFCNRLFFKLVELLNAFCCRCTTVGLLFDDDGEHVFVFNCKLLE